MLENSNAKVIYLLSFLKGVSEPLLEKVSEIKGTVNTANNFKITRQNVPGKNRY